MGSISVKSRADNPLARQISNILDESTLDPEMHYAFVQERSTNIARKKMLGYRQVNREEHGVKTVAGLDEDDGTGAIRDGDTVLMMVPKKDKEARDRQKQSLRKTRLANADGRFKEMAARSGVKIATEGVGNEPSD